MYHKKFEQQQQRKQAAVWGEADVRTGLLLVQKDMQ